MNLIPRNFFLDDFFDTFDGKLSRANDLKCDIYEEDNNYVVEMDIPGFNKDEINIDVEKGYLTISASHDEEKDDEGKNYIRKERFYGSTKRQFYVGDVDEESIKASFNDGVLKVVVPKKEEISTKKKIEIE